MITKRHPTAWAPLGWLVAIAACALAGQAMASREAFEPKTEPRLEQLEPAAGASPPEEPVADHTNPDNAEANHSTTTDHASTETGTEGGHGESKPKPKKSKGPPPLPEVLIGGQRVKRAQTAAAAAEATVLPEAFKTIASQQKLQNRLNFTPYAHSPRFGEPNAKITVVIFEDLNCLSCTTTSQGITTALQDIFTSPTTATSLTTPTIPAQVLWVYAPSSRFQGSNLAAFYGKVAARHGQFWAYRDKLLQLPDRTTETAFGVLSQLGLEPRVTRQIMLSEARRFYRELDGDTQQARALGMGNTPSVLVNGIRLGDHGLALTLLPDVLTYVRNRIQAGMVEPPL